MSNVGQFLFAKLKIYKQIFLHDAISQLSFIQLSHF